MVTTVTEKRCLVLVVEDNPDGAESLRVLLNLCGFDVRVAYTGGAGVILARRWRPHVVVCDIGLPDLDGFGVARALRQDPATAGARLIALTAYGDDVTRRRASESGFDDFLVKPADPQELMDLLAETRDSHGPPAG
jgi:two-component system, sensor histidine kinase